MTASNGILISKEDIKTVFRNLPVHILNFVLSSRLENITACIFPVQIHSPSLSERGIRASEIKEEREIVCESSGLSVLFLVDKKVVYLEPEIYEVKE